MTKEHEIADIVVYLKLPSRETIKRKHTTALHKTAGEPGGEHGGEHGGERAAGCCDSLPAIPLVFADGSLRTHRLSLVGISYGAHGRYESTYGWGCRAKRRVLHLYYSIIIYDQRT